MKHVNLWIKSNIYLAYNSILQTKLIQLQNKLFSKFYNYSESVKNTLTLNAEFSSIWRKLRVLMFVWPCITSTTMKTTKMQQLFFIY